MSNACSLKDSQNFLMQSLPLYTSWLSSMLLNDDIVDIKKSDGICSPYFVIVKFQHPSILSIKDSRSA